MKSEVVAWLKWNKGSILKSNYKEPNLRPYSPRVLHRPVIRASNRYFWKVMDSTPAGELGDLFSE